MIKSLVTELILSYLFPPQRLEGEAERSNPLSLGDLGSLIYITKDTFMALITWEFKDFRSSVSGTGTKTKYILLI